MYLIKCKGYSHAENTWEPYSHLHENCSDAIKKFREFFRNMGGKVKQLTDADVLHQRTATPHTNIFIDIDTID
ncbi:hypothetical protein DAPPUDRAFT_331654 [Daphnia pulex]|uniref:Chromo domain-containing protein n=1 Tax=Daphnia pulex TaxID=6669 RepID=E9HN13_DAPPU|nr:hypothetical protein DAPPUDRAFT_331654 [Daphnia pulex]|eukprot:EFX66874.1 hypothetical protein DAPPUDRAFT_331654 [Daphnia pulex]